MKCPLTTNQYGNRPPCLGGECELTDEAGNCLIKQALQCYINATKAKITNDTELLRRENELTQIYSAAAKGSFRSNDPYPDGFPDYPLPSNASRIDAYDTPVPGGVKYAHITPTKQYPHGGWFEAPYCDDERPEVAIY